MTKSIKTFKSFHRAFHAMPAFLAGGHDPLRHKTVADLGWLARHEIDLFDEGEDSDIKTPTQRATCVDFARRCGLDVD